MAFLTRQCCTPHTSTLLSWNVSPKIGHLSCFSGSDSMVTSIVNVSTIFLFSGEAEDNVCHGLVARCKKWKLPRVSSLLALERKMFWLHKNSKGGVGKTPWGIELGRSTVFLKKLHWNQKNVFQLIFQPVIPTNLWPQKRNKRYGKNCHLHRIYTLFVLTAQPWLPKSQHQWRQSMFYRRSNFKTCLPQNKP